MFLWWGLKIAVSQAFFLGWLNVKLSDWVNVQHFNIRVLCVFFFFWIPSYPLYLHRDCIDSLDSRCTVCMCEALHVLSVMCQCIKAGMWLSKVLCAFKTSWSSWLQSSCRFVLLLFFYHRSHCVFSTSISTSNIHHFISSIFFWLHFLKLISHVCSPVSFAHFSLFINFFHPPLTLCWSPFSSPPSTDYNRPETSMYRQSHGDICLCSHGCCHYCSGPGSKVRST